MHFLQVASQGIEESISASVNVTLGDKGNPQVTNELNKLGMFSIWSKFGLGNCDARYEHA